MIQKERSKNHISIKIHALKEESTQAQGHFFFENEI